MPSIVDMLLKKTGKTRADLAAKRGKVGAVFRRAGVSDSPELRRIIDIPRRDWEVGIGGRFGTTSELVDLLTNLWKTPDGQMTLWPQQAVGLAELHDFGGLVAPIRTSGGKTLLELLAANSINAKQPLLIVPSFMTDIMHIRHEQLSLHWQLPKITIIGYEFLSLKQNEDYLNELMPDLILADEAQRLKNLKAACTRRVHWYMTDNPGTVFVPLSGTPFNRSLTESAHLVNWALPKWSPIPKDYGTQLEWALCLDEEKTGVNALAPGKLIKLYNEEELVLSKSDPLRAARKSFQRRFCETPGVVSVSDPGVTIPLHITGFDLDIDEPVIDEAFDHVRKFWRAPDGRPFSEGVKVWNFCRQLTGGFYYIYDPYPPKGWLGRKIAYYRDERHILNHNQRRLATGLQVRGAIEAGLYDVPSYWEWLAVKDSFKPKSKAVWVHLKTVNYAKAWLDNNPTGICWTEHIAFARCLEKVSGYSYYGEHGKNDAGQMIEDASGPVIASVKGNGTGRDLQHKWNKNLIISCAPNGETWEQLLARTHREGQKADKVTVEVLMACSEHYYGFQQALRDAQFQSDMLKQSRKLLIADINLEAIEKIVATSKATRWNKGIRNN